jgi:integrase
MPYVFLDKRKKPWVYRFQFTDAKGRRRTGTGTTKKAETEEMAAIVQAKQTAIRKTWADAPKASASAKSRDFSKITAQYSAWGESCGGVGGRPWAPEHAEKREAGLAWWKKELGFQTLADLDGVLPRVENALRGLQEAKKSNLTIRHRATCLSAFCHWCVQRGLLDDDPLKGMVAFPKQAKQARRAMTAAEVQKLLEHCTPERRRMYECALASGLRANELRSLTVADVDAERGGLRLHAEWTKNRKPGFQPLPSPVVARLVEACKGRAGDAPLLEIGTQPARDLKRDFDKAKLLKFGPGGKVDFHALRVAYTTFVIESGANIKEAQALARHSTADLTLSVYAKARQERLSEVAEAVGRAALPSEAAEAVVIRTGTDDAPVVVESTPLAHGGKRAGSAVATSHAAAYTSDLSKAEGVRFPCTPASFSEVPCAEPVRRPVFCFPGSYVRSAGRSSD